MWAEKAVELGVGAYKAIMEGCGSGMAICSDKYEKGEMYVPEILMSARAMYQAIDILKRISRRKVHSRDTVMDSLYF